MSTRPSQNPADPEIEAIRVIYNVLSPLDAQAQARVIKYAIGKLGIHSEFSRPFQATGGQEVPATEEAAAAEDRATGGRVDPSDGINPVARKWMARAGFSSAQLGNLFSLGGDEIDLITDSVPGKSKTQRMRSVLLLKAVAAYLSGGAARVSHDELKETCLHYDAFDSANFARHLKEFSAEVSGTKESGYTLTARGLAAATKLVRQIVQRSTKQAD